MVRPGLVSVTFRRLPPAEVVRAAVLARLEGIEWGADVHVRPGDLNQAREVRQRTFDAGLAVASYGSYYRVGQGEEGQAPFEAVLETALVLGAPTVRVWAGPADRLAVLAGLVRIGIRAGAAGVEVATEFHDGTLADSAAAAAALLDEAGLPGLKTYWQAPHGMTDQQRLAGLRLLGPRVSNLHVFHWTQESPGEHLRHPLAASTGWPRWLKTVCGWPGDRWALLEFTAGDSVEQLTADAAVLRKWLLQHQETLQRRDALRVGPGTPVDAVGPELNQLPALGPVVRTVSLPVGHQETPVAQDLERGVEIR